MASCLRLRRGSWFVVRDTHIVEILSLLTKVSSTRSRTHSLNMKSALALAMAAVAVGQSIPPAEFNLPTAQNNTQLGVAFQQTTGQTAIVQPGILFGKGGTPNPQYRKKNPPPTNTGEQDWNLETKMHFGSLHMTNSCLAVTMMQPSIAINGKNSATLARFADDGGNLLLVMIDPDAPSPDMPTSSAILHWMAPNLAATTNAQDFGPLQGQSVLSNSTPNAVPFAPPGPPATSSAHRYLLFLFEQPQNFAVPAQFAQFNAMNRANFDLNGFIAAAGLSAPLAVNFMYVSGQDVVPADFQGAPFSTFPGGNGNAIGLPGSTAGTVANGTMSTAPSTATGSAAGGMAVGGAGQATMGMGMLNADGSCSCSVVCPAGSFM